MTGLLVRAMAAISSIPTSGPERMMALIAASMRSLRRLTRCAVQRARRPSTDGGGVTEATVSFTLLKVADTLSIRFVFHQMSPDRVTDLRRPKVRTRRAAVVGGNRIPFARSNGKYSHASNQDMLTAAIDGLVARYGLQNERVGEVASGAVLKPSRDFNLTREAVLGSTLSPTTPAY